MQDLIPVLAGPVLGLLSTALAFLAYRRGMRADDHAAGITASTQVSAGNQAFIDNIQADNRDLRGRLETVQRELDELKRKSLNG